MVCSLFGDSDRLYLIPNLPKPLEAEESDNTDRTFASIVPPQAAVGVGRGLVTAVVVFAASAAACLMADPHDYRDRRSVTDDYAPDRR